MAVFIHSIGLFFHIKARYCRPRSKVDDYLGHRKVISGFRSETGGRRRVATVSDADRPAANMVALTAEQIAKVGRKTTSTSTSSSSSLNGLRL